ncbi:hypothetical protein EXS65_03320 [Candidatus Peribacteria bacterium]|nr:hypothetical protein [Candidatus Peribacteria bacterium]
MKISLKHLTPLLLAVALVGCAGTSATTQETDDTEPTAATTSSENTGTAAASDDHHEGEIDVQPHDDSAAAPADHVDDPKEPAHGHSSSHDDSNKPPHRD